MSSRMTRSAWSIFVNAGTLVLSEFLPGADTEEPARRVWVPLAHREFHELVGKLALHVRETVVEREVPLLVRVVLDVEQLLTAARKIPRVAIAISSNRARPTRRRGIEV